jgi:hypothetical protein
MLRFQAGGAKDCFRLAHALHEAGQKDLKRELDKASREAGNVIVDAVRADTDKYIPRDFEKSFKASLEAKVEVRLIQGRRISAVFWAMGKSYRRKIEEMNAGTLRHPVFGRSRRLKRHWIHKATSQLNEWVDQPIRPGLVDEPARAAMPKAVEKIEDAVHRVVDKIGR